MESRFHNERGAMLIHVALTLGTVIAMSAFAIDYGMLLVGRSQIQTAADAGALAGATALAFDSFSDRTNSGPAKAAALGVATANTVAGAPPSVTTADISFPACPDSFAAGPSVPPNLACVRVNVYRTLERGNPLPSFFGQMLGVTSSDVTATAVAQARAANATNCLKPLAIPDRWTERSPAAAVWTAGLTFEKWDPADTTMLLVPPDSYSAPRPTASGTGLTMSGADGVGTRVVIEESAVATGPQPWRYRAVQIPGSMLAGFRNNIEECARSTVSIGDRLPLQAGVTAGDAAVAMQTLINRDPGATWNATLLDVQGSCADAVPSCGALSPRIIAVPLYDPSDYADAARAGATSVLVRNIVGLFVESVSGTSITARIVRHPGTIRSSAPGVIDASAFLRTVLLVE
jgi:hypothetical protein